MQPSTIKVDRPAQEDRFSRLSLIPWWDQEKIRATNVLVVGAGALGNEILKNLAMLGFGRVAVVDMDDIEITNLSRSVLFRATDVGNSKAKAVASAYCDLLPGAMVQPLVANIMRDCGLGLFLWADIILGGLDNREARLWINRSAWKTGKTWIDGAIEGINGVARMFVAGQEPCYECTLGETDWAILNRRMSCNLLLHDPNPEGRTPTTPTISSIIAGIQVQEAVKSLHGLPTLAGKGYVFEGLHHTSYVTEYTANADCQSHYTIDEIVALPQASSELTLEQLLTRAREDLKADEVVLDFSRDVIQKLVCPTCHSETECYVPVGAVSYADGACPNDGTMRVVQTLSGFHGQPGLGERTLDTLGLPLFDIFTARSASSEISYCISGDAIAILGPLAPIKATA